MGYKHMTDMESVFLPQMHGLYFLMDIKWLQTDDASGVCIFATDARITFFMDVKWYKQMTAMGVLFFFHRCTDYIFMDGHYKQMTPTESINLVKTIESFFNTNMTYKYLAINIWL